MKRNATPWKYANNAVAISDIKSDTFLRVWFKKRMRNLHHVTIIKKKKRLFTQALKNTNKPSNNCI